MYFDYWSGTLPTGPTTWSGIIYLGGDLTIPSGATLNIDPGTEIRVLSGDDQNSGTWTDRAELIVQGTLNVNGGLGEGNEVTFRSDDEDHPTYLSVWGGIRVEAGGNATFRYAHIRNATRAVQLNGAIGTVDWGTDPDAETVIEYSQTGLYASGLNGRTLQNTRIHQVTTGVRLENCTSTTVRNISVTGPTGNIVEVTGGSGNALRYNTLVGNQSYQTAIWLNNTASPSVMDNHIQDVGIGIQAAGSTSGVMADNNTLWHLLIKQFDGFTPGSHNYSVDPRLQTGSLQLAADSPLINAGSGGAAKRAAVHQTNPPDIGRYGDTSQDIETALTSIAYSNGFYLGEDFSEDQGSWSYDGTNQEYVQSSNYSVARTHRPEPATTDYTLETRLRFSGNEQGKLIFADADRSEAYRIDMTYHSQRITLFINGAMYHYYTTVNQNTWYRLAARIVGNTVSVYRDGQPLPGLQNIPFSGHSSRAYGLGNYQAVGRFDDVYIIDESDGSGGGGGGGIANGNFESGLSGWTATGPFALNNTWPLNSGYTQNGLEGSYCAGSHLPETGTGTLTSASFTIDQPYLNFRIGGWHQYSGQGGFNQVRLEPAGGGTSLCSSNPTNTNDLVQKTWNVSALQGQNVRLVAQDNHTQGGYAWMSVDAFGLSGAPAVSPEAVCARDRTTWATPARPRAPWPWGSTPARSPSTMCISGPAPPREWSPSPGPCPTGWC